MMQDIRAKQAEIEGRLFADQPIVEGMALELYKTDPARARAFISDYSNRVAQENFMKWWELADRLITDYQDGGLRTTPDKRAVPAEWLQKQGPIGTQVPAAPVKK
jgi:hypothetical protein